MIMHLTTPPPPASRVYPPKRVFSPPGCVCMKYIQSILYDIIRPVYIPTTRTLLYTYIFIPENHSPLGPVIVRNALSVSTQ